MRIPKKKSVAAKDTEGLEHSYIAKWYNHFGK